MRHTFVIPPRPELAPWVLHLLAMRLDACMSQLPSMLSPCVTMFAHGSASREAWDRKLLPVLRAA